MIKITIKLLYALNVKEFLILFIKRPKECFPGWGRQFSTARCYSRCTRCTGSFCTASSATTSSSSTPKTWSLRPPP